MYIIQNMHIIAINIHKDHGFESEQGGVYGNICRRKVKEEMYFIRSSKPKKKRLTIFENEGLIEF